MDLSNLQAPKGANRARKRVGRGQGSTWGKTAGAGQKGQNSRAGGGVRPGFEGGQMPLQMRIPKRGFNNIHALRVDVVNLHSIERAFEDGDVVDLDALYQKGLIDARTVSTKNGEVLQPKADFIKILGQGDLTKKLTVTAHRFSKSAKEKIEAAGGSVNLIENPSKS